MLPRHHLTVHTRRHGFAVRFIVFVFVLRLIHAQPSAECMQHWTVVVIIAPPYTACVRPFSLMILEFKKNKKHLKNVGPIHHCEPPHANSPDVASGTVARRLRIDVHDNADDDNDNA